MELTEDYSCGYCLQRLPYMTDPRELPCSHVFCLPCLQQDYEESDSDSSACVICGRFTDQALEVLSKVETATMCSSSSSASASDEKLQCDLCKDQDHVAMSYCAPCGKKLCEQHLKVHQDYWNLFSGDGHSTVDINVFKMNEYKYLHEMCDTHKQQRLVQACGKCDKIFCLKCETEADCGLSKAEDKDKSHQAIELPKFAKGLRREMKVQMQSLSQKITDTCKLEKEAWRSLDDAEVKVKNMIEEVGRITEEQIKDIREKSVAITEQLKEHLDGTTQQIEGYTSSVMSTREHLQDLWRSTHQLLRQTPDGGFISKRKEHAAQISEALALETKSSEVFMGALLSTESARSPEVSFIQEPLEFVSSSEAFCSSVCWTKDNNIITTGDANITLYDSKLTELNSVDTDDGDSIAEHHSGYVLMNYVDVEGPGKGCEEVKLYSKDLQSFKMIDKYPTISSYIHVTFNPLTQHIIAVDDAKKQLRVYINNRSPAQYCVELEGVEKPRGIHALPDGTILVSDYTGGTVSRYSLSAPPQAIKTLWTCTGLSKPAGISADKADRIYVASDGHESIYIISRNGKLMGELTHPQLKHNDVCDVSVTDDKMVVACRDEGVKIFRISI